VDLLRHIRVLWDHRLALAVGTLVGTLLAILVGYDVHLGESPLITQRGQEEWMSVSRLLVTQEGFPEGRVTLPAAAVGGQPVTGGLTFADPSRFQGLASLYAVLASSDQVRSRLRERPAREQITALVVDPDGPGSLSSLPVIELSTVASSATAASRLNIHTISALRGVLTTEQNHNRIDAASRVRLDTLDFPSAPLLVSGRSHMASIVVFAIALLGAIACAQLMEGVGKARSVRARPQSATVDRSPGAWGLAAPELPPGHDAAAAGELRRL
jgi:hypothetical protein